MVRPALLTSLLLLFAVPAAEAATPKRLPVKWAKQHKLAVKSAAKDKDRDGLTNWGEYRAGTNPRKLDTDRDGVLDVLEDRDRDKLVNGDEIAAGTDPRKRDSDADKLVDGREDRDRDGLANADERVTGHDLRVRDTNSDGIPDGADNAGWITASAAGNVTIRLARGGTITARLTGESWVDCTATAGAPTAETSTSSPTANPDPIDPVDEDVVPVDELPDAEDDPAGLPAAFLTDDPEEGAEIAETETVDLGDCAAVLRVGATVHRALVEGGVLTDLELIKS